ncbi:MAG: TonB-dependent receptor [Pseudomonadota bacterium]
MAYTKTTRTLTLIGLIAGAPVQAQSPGDERDPPAASPALEEVVVYGTKQGLTLQEAEVSVEVFDAQRMAQENMFNLDDLLQRTPNVQTTGSTAAFSIRGVSRFGVGGAGQGVTSNVYLDGAPVTSIALSYGFDSLWDIGQVEVLRGPQSTVQGRNALAGAVVMRTNDPAYEWEFRGRLRFAEDATHQYAGVLSGPIVDDQLAFRLALDRQETDGFATNGFSGSANLARENTLVRTKILYEPNVVPQLRALLTVDYNDNDTGPQTPAVFANIAADDPEFPTFDFYEFVSYIPPERSDNETTRVIGDVDYELSEALSLKFLGTYERNELYRVLGDPDNPGQIDSVVNEDVINAQDTDTYSAELRLEYAQERWSGAVGAYYFRDQFTLDSTFFSPLLNDVFFPIDPETTLVTGFSSNETQTRNYAVYARLRFDMNPRWTFDFSARYDYEEYETTGDVTRDPGVLPADCSATLPDFLRDALGYESNEVPCIDLVLLATQAVDNPNQADSFSAFLPRAAVTYNLRDDLALVVSAQRGYRAGGTYLQLTTEGQQVRNYDPEYLTNYEAGMRSQWLERALVINANIFFSEFEDQQVRVPGPSGSFTDEETVNAGKSTLYGVEVMGEYQWTESLGVYASLGLLRAEFDDFPFAAPGLPYDNLAGNDLPLAPRLSVTLGANYRHASGVFINASVNHASSQHSQVLNFTEADLGPGVTEEVGSRTLASLRVGYTGNRFMAFVYGTNLFDEDTSASALRAFVGPESGNINYREAPLDNVTPPRAFGIGVDFAL